MSARFVLFLNSLLVFTPTLATDELVSNAPYTAAELCADATRHEASLILSFLYWSYCRSAATLHLQTTLRNRLIDDIAELEGFYHLRHNPERPLSAHAACRPHREEPHIDCATYERISRMYASCCKHLLAEHTLLSREIRDRLITLRNHVRGEISTHLATKLMETYDILGTVYTTLQSLYMNYGHLLFKNKHATDRARSVFSSLWSYIPSFLINIAYQFEDKHLQLRQDLFYIIQKDIDISDDLWREIETIRSTFYRTMYARVYHYVYQAGYDTVVFTDQFSYDTQQAIELPHPDALSIV